MLLEWDAHNDAGGLVTPATMPELSLAAVEGDVGMMVLDLEVRRSHMLIIYTNETPNGCAVVDETTTNWLCGG